ncbi:MAG: class I SAM-dependent methyltransferase [Gemmataceae bacterium]|nr:class I SAM-dependent methyltransferase [Gemmataceae bacterium]
MTAEAVAFADLFAAEDRHFWFRGRNRVIAGAVRDAVQDFPPGYRVLEVGCGTGYVLRLLERECRGAVVIGSEVSDEGVAFARRRVGSPVVRADVYALPFADPFHLVGMFDVLEHLPDDARALQELRAATAPGGRLVLTVPAYMSLWSHTDESSGHYRRYTPTTLRRVLTEAGWVVERLTPFMLPLVPVMWAGRKLAALANRLRGRKKTGRELAVGELRPVPGFNVLMRGLLALEAPFVRRWRLPVGTSLLAVARNPAGSAARVAA